MQLKSLSLILTLISCCLLGSTANAACNDQTITFSVSPAGLTGTRCLTAADLTQLQTALASPLIAAGNPTPSAAVEWNAAIGIMVNALNEFASNYLKGQALLQTPVVAFTGAN